MRKREGGREGGREESACVCAQVHTCVRENENKGECLHGTGVYVHGVRLA